MKKFAQDAAVHMMGMSVMLEGQMARGTKLPVFLMLLPLWTIF